MTERWTTWVAFCRCLGLVVLAALTGCASVYIDGQLKEVDAAQYGKASSNHAVQLLFEFQSKGVVNARATATLKTRVAEQIRTSGVFSDVSDSPVTGAALLSITLNNVPLSDDAFSKGFVTGLTFGLAGSQVSDGYVCVAQYHGPGSNTAISKQARHALHTTMGNASAPPNSVKADSVEAAVFTMTRQIISHVLKELSNDPGFK